MSLGFKRLTH